MAFLLAIIAPPSGRERQQGLKGPIKTEEINGWMSIFSKETVLYAGLGCFLFVCFKKKNPCHFRVSSCPFARRDFTAGLTKIWVSKQQKPHIVYTTTGWLEGRMRFTQFQ